MTSPVTEVATCLSTVAIYVSKCFLLKSVLGKTCFTICFLLHVHVDKYGLVYGGI